MSIDAIDTDQKAMNTCLPVTTSSFTFCFCRPAAFSYEENKAKEEKYQQDFNHQIISAFAQLLVNLFRCVYHEGCWRIPAEKNWLIL